MGDTTTKMPDHVTKEFVDTRINLERTAKFAREGGTPTPVIRMAAPFSVETRDGTIKCEDGWLAIDSDGWPYAITDDEFRRTYEPTDKYAEVYLEAMP